MTRCRNCGNASRFVLSVECAFVVPASDRPTPDWSLSLQCPDCASTDLAGQEPVSSGRPGE